MNKIIAYILLLIWAGIVVYLYLSNERLNEENNRLIEKVDGHQEEIEALRMINDTLLQDIDSLSLKDSLLNSEIGRQKEKYYLLSKRKDEAIKIIGTFNSGELVEFFAGLNPEDSIN